MTDVIVRPAGKDEADTGASLLFMSGPELFTYAFGRPPEATRKLLARLWPRNEHIFSYQWAHFAEADSQVLGIISGFTSQELRRASSRMPIVFARALWPWDLARLIGRAVDMAGLSPEVPDGDYYVGHVAVVPEARSQGIGHELMAFAEERARQRDCRRCALDVTVENLRAQAVYRDCGYVIADTHKSPRLAERCGISGMHRMVKLLSD